MCAINFRKKAKGAIKEDDIKESFTREEWIWLIGLNQRVNSLLHDKLITNQDGNLRLVLEHEVYVDGAWLAENFVLTCMGPTRRSTSKMLHNSRKFQRFMRCSQVNKGISQIYFILKFTLLYDIIMSS
jgi:hypothetical protein